MECRSPSPDDSTYPQTPVRSVKAGARLSSESLLLDEFPKVNSQAEATMETRPPSSSGHRPQEKPPLPADAFLSQLARLDTATPMDEDAEFGRDAIAWILSSLCSYMTWPGKDIDQNPFGPIHPSNAIRISQLDSHAFSVPDVTPEAALIRESTAARWKAGAVPVVKKLWELIAGIIESQVRLNLSQVFYWSSEYSMGLSASFFDSGSQQWVGCQELLVIWTLIALCCRRPAICIHSAYIYRPRGAVCGWSG